MKLVKKPAILTIVLLLLFSLLLAAGAEAKAVKPPKPPARVTGVAAKLTKPDTVKVTWGKAKNARKYEVYRAASKTGKYSKVKTTSGRSFTDKNRVAGKTYWYKVRAARVVKWWLGFCPP